MSEISFLEGYSLNSADEVQSGRSKGSRTAPLLAAAAVCDLFAALSLASSEFRIHLIAYILVAFVALPAILFSRVQADRRTVEEGILVSRQRQRFSALLLAASLLVCFALAVMIAWATA